MDFHEIAALFPLMGEAELSTLADDIKAHGLLQSIVLLEGKILDGRNRYLACQQVGVKPRFETYTGGDPLGYVVSTNLKRRHLNESQRAMIGARMANMPSGYRADLEPPATLPEVVSQSVAAKEVEVSERSVRKAKKVLQEAAPEQIQAVEEGKVTITAVARQLKEAKRETRRQENAEKAKAVSDPLAAQARFATILLDPPWDCGDEGDVNQLGRAKPDYATMPLEKLLALPVPELADTDCHIYLWITNRSLPKGFPLLEAWGFRYITCLTWVKPSFGMGNYFRGQTEHLLFGVKGSQPLKRHDVGTVFHAERGPAGHSSKPAEIYALIESCSPGPYLEMFARQQRPGWHTWGADAKAI